MSYSPRTLRSIMAVLWLGVAACSPWVPDSFPVKVDLSDELTPEQRNAAIEACDTWNTRVGASVLRPVESNGRRLQRGRIAVRADRPRPGEIATSTANAWHCTIAVRGLGYDPNTMIHELGHCLGLEHDRMPHSIMNEYSQPGQALLPEHIEYVRDLVSASERRNEDEDP
jgi:hypothetical protein